MVSSHAAMRLSASQAVQAFVEHLKCASVLPRLLRIASFGNSFEGWLKWELAEMLCSSWGRRPWTDQTPAATWLTIGVEHKAALDTLGAAKARKQVDLWVVSDPKADRYHYVELKVVFNNGNAAKQLASAESDFAVLQRVRDNNLDGRIALVVAVGFGTDDLSDVEGAQIFPIAASLGEQADATPAVAVLALVAGT